MRRRVTKASAKELVSKWFFGASVAQRIARIYVLIILAGFGALNLPWVQTHKGENTKDDTWFSKLFTSVSAFTTTGLLSGSSLKCSFNFAGQLIVLILIQIGGLGIVTIWMILKQTFLKNKKYSIEDRLNIYSERGGGGMSEGSSYVVIKSALISLLGFELFVAALLTFFFYFIGSIPQAQAGTKNQFLASLWAGIFHSISAVNNAGLDILDKSSISSFSRGWGTILSIVFAVCSMVGGIGYPALYEFKEWLQKKRNKEKTKNIFSLFTKISILMYLSITLLASGGIILAEYTDNNWTQSDCDKGCGKLQTIEKIWQLVYLVISSRSAGFYGIDPICLHEKSQWILLILMFIGASPASTAGGIRSITLFLMLGKIWVTMRGRRTLSIFSRSISDQTIESAYIVFFVSSALITLCSLGIPNPGEQQEKKGLRHASLFEAASAFGTAGLSLGVSNKTPWYGKLLLMFLMFVGQLGIPNSLIYYNKPRVSKQKFSYPEEKLRIA
ncbi:potassium uptake protein KTRB [Mycoplasma wenyonii str. Massachusetts]|uniref:Potassium uptake protein KTRB n=1 Tax=Mycoplasma wenyonii (strain Massachusetts) TaxID=1197325 RepID=I6Z6J1_MYCWM|nr:potassium transporter TrkG [Mycoplasma wenyonii]AFN65213.1 potassium uptake protein KTRB [Mycoplasma wenyonii str. Massachusetts]